MPLSQKEIRERAVAFVHEWKDESRERAESQTFWNEFLQIFDVKRRRVAIFEQAVKKNNQNTGAIDLFWRGVLLAEHKSRGQNLEKATSQAFEYLENLKESELPKCVVISDFAQFRLFDLEAGEEHAFPLEQLPDKIHLFGFISGYTQRSYKDQDPVNIAVAEKMGELHDALLASGYEGHELEIFLVRLIYCLFADDTGIFPRDHFGYYIESRTREDGADTGSLIANIFQTLNTAEVRRQKSIDEDLQQFPYVNGALFAEPLPIPSFDKKMRQVLLDCCGFDWSKVSPAIFGSMFQSVMDKTKRRNLGAHYTSEKNILKLVRGLFLDELYAEFESSKNNRNKLKTLHEKLARLRFFDPACGCGNFLVITYREIRQLELEIIKQERQLSGDKQLLTDISLIALIDVDSVYGIELEEFPARIAEVALWLVDHQMNMRLSAEFGLTYIRLPLSKTANIKHGNALRLSWEEVMPKPAMPEYATTETTLYILGNPPFVGKSNQSAAQKSDMEFACSKLDNLGVLDFVCAWYIKAAQYIQNTRAKVAFVSTNSITQGEQVSALWSYLLDQNIKIHFAHRTFKWSNEARGNANVFCVIIGFAAFDTNGKKLYDYETPQSEPMEIAASNINPYLIDTDDIVIPSRNKPLCNVPGMVAGNKPNDGGHLILSDEEKHELLRNEPSAEKFIRKFLGSEEFINGKIRWCLWLKNASPVELRAMPEVMKRVEAVKRSRLESGSPEALRLAAIPYLFRDTREPENYLMVPLVSSEQRNYIPIGFLTKETIASNLASVVPNATLYHFGILTSAMHMAWMRQVCGRLKSDYRYSNNLVYNNFPFPTEPASKQKDRVEQSAQAVLDARLQFPDSTLADLYDPNTMPKALLDAHRGLDAAVDACYGKASFKSDLERLKFLFALYRQYTEPLAEVARIEERRAKRKK